jgi:UDP-N-acetylglucosamine diphosphorylase / glucose-1-phosphate thymidylyltransferase / UDP-N-acetylgalactosamine diphosphorylase / glucosamine-1-phosphate N-acetyltransferase / galactosamine-1-phosphate N-acetyltransferase
MKRVVLRRPTAIPPFGEAARELRILNKPLWLFQRDLLARHCQSTIEIDQLDDLPPDDDELLVHCDNQFFNAELIDEFISAARQRGQACQLAFAADDQAITTHALHLQHGIQRRGDVWVAEVLYFPRGTGDEPQPLVIDTAPREMGYYHIPSYMAPNHGDLTYQIPLRAFLSIEHWVHVFLANSPFGVFAWARRMEAEVETSWRAKLRVSLRAMWERKHFLQCSALVKVGKNCSIDPTAIIQGPTVIGNNVHIGAGAVVVSSMIGNNVTIMQGSQVMLSVVSDRCYLPFNASLFMTTLMDNTMVAQLSCLQMCVVGRNTFIGAGNIFTDFDLMGKPIKTMWNGALHPVGMPVIGSAVGHNVKIGSGFVVYPARMIESDTVLAYADDHAVIPKNVESGTYTRPPVFYPDRDPRVQLHAQSNEFIRP